MEDSNLYNGLIFIIEKYDCITGKSSLATAPFFLINECDESITIKQIRDANFSALVSNEDNLIMRLYVIRKDDVPDDLRNGKFRDLIVRLICQICLGKSTKENFIDLLLLAKIRYSVSNNTYQNINQGIIGMVFEKMEMENNKVYLYNPSITLSKEYLLKM